MSSSKNVLQKPIIFYIYSAIILFAYRLWVGPKSNIILESKFCPVYLSGGITIISIEIYLIYLLDIPSCYSITYFLVEIIKCVFISSFLALSNVIRVHGFISGCFISLNYCVSAYALLI